MAIEQFLEDRTLSLKQLNPAGWMIHTAVASLSS